MTSDISSHRMLLLAPGMFALAAFWTDKPSKAVEPCFSQMVLFEEETDGFKLYRIPGIVVTKAGTALAYCEARKFTEADRGEIEIHLRRSSDGGDTWSPPQQVAHLGPRLPRNPHMSEKKKHKNMGGPEEQTVNNAVAIADRSGAVHLLYCVEYMRCFVIRSDDDGLTWTSPREITSTFDEFRDQLDWQVIATGPGHGIQLQNGRLVVPFWMTDYERRGPLTKAAAVIYSDDGGETWHAGEIAVPLGGEPNVAELSDGRVLVTSRNTHPRNRRLATTSPNGATAWSEPALIEELLEPGCMAGLVSHPGGDASQGASRQPMLMFSHPYTTERSHQARRDVTIQVSWDDGRSWPWRKRLHAGPSAYSDLAVLPNGEVLCFYESGGDQPSGKRKRPWAYRYLTVARFNLAWLMQGE